jgi:MEMO1 family protein
MPLVFSAITPHPPLLIPTIGKDDNLQKIAKTKQAMEKLEEDLYLSRPDIILIISPHGSHFNDAFTININPGYETDLREFGDLTTKLKFKGEMNLSSYIRESSKDLGIPTSMISEEKLDHGSSVPLYYLTQHLENIPILPIGFCSLEWKLHVDFGYMLKNDIAKSNKRVAVIASGDMSHALVTDAPAGYNPAGEKFDKKIREILQDGNTAGMLQMDKQFVEDAAECGFRSFLMLMGLLRNVKYNYKEYSYEAPFGVGYLVANFVI